MKIRRPRLEAKDTRKVQLRDYSNPHYQTVEHQRWASEVIRRSGGYCQDPRCTKPQGWRGLLYADHIHELRDGGAPLDLANGIARCGSCHVRKTLAVRAQRMKSPT